MFTKPEYKLEDLTAAVKRWIDVIYRILIKPLPKLDTSLNAGEVGGRKLADIRAEVNAGIDAHINAVYPHKPTLSHLFQTSSLHQHNFTNWISVNWTSAIVTVTAFDINILGKTYRVPGYSKPLLAGTNYLVLVGSGTRESRKFELVLSDRPMSGFLKYTVVILYRSPNSMVRVPIYRID